LCPRSITKPPTHPEAVNNNNNTSSKITSFGENHQKNLHSSSTQVKGLGNIPIDLKGQPTEKVQSTFVTAL
jgi:hypothetical protein